jgi:hypothetical protein
VQIIDKEVKRIIKVICPMPADKIVERVVERLLQDGPFDQCCRRLVKEGSLTSAVVGIAGQRPLIIKIAFHLTSCHASQDSERLELLYQRLNVSTPT